MTFEDDARDAEQGTKDAFAEGKKDIKDAWTDTKAAGEKAEHEVESEADKL